MFSQVQPGQKKWKAHSTEVPDMKVLPMLIFTMGWMAAYTLVAPSLGASIENAIRKDA